LDVLLPELAAYLSDAEEDNQGVWRLLTEVDRETIARGAALDDVVLWATLLLEPMREACEGSRDRIAAAYDFLEPVVDRLNVPRRIADAVRRLVAMLPRLEHGKAGRFSRTGLYPFAEQLLQLRSRADAPRAESKTAEEPAPPKRRRRARRTPAES
jgi:poly(A) polymerase